MTVQTQFNVGDRVVDTRSGHRFTVAAIRVETLGPSVTLTEYRAEYKTKRNGPWVAQRYLTAPQTIICAGCRDQITPRQSSVQANDGAMFHRTCWGMK